MNIGEVAERANVSASRIRYYERIGILPAPERVSGRRRYDERVLRNLDAILLMQSAGFTLAEVRTLLYEFGDDVPPSERWRRLASGKLAEIEAIIEHALDTRDILEQGMRCDCLSFEDCDLLAS